MTAEETCVVAHILGELGEGLDLRKFVRIPGRTRPALNVARELTSRLKERLLT